MKLQIAETPGCAPQDGRRQLHEMACPLRRSAAWHGAHNMRFSLSRLPREMRVILLQGKEIPLPVAGRVADRAWAALFCMAGAYENQRPEQRASEWVVMPKSAPPSGKTRMRRPAHPRRAFGFSAGLGRGRSSRPALSQVARRKRRGVDTGQHRANKCLGRPGRSAVLGSGLEYAVPCERLGIIYQGHQSFTLQSRRHRLAPTPRF